MARTPKAMICQGQVMPVSNARAPTTMAAMPNHKKCTPGRKVSSVNNSAPRMNQFQAPKPERRADTDGMARNPDARTGSDGALGGRYAAIAARGGAARRRDLRAPVVSVEGFTRDFGEAGQRADDGGGLQRQHQHLLVGRAGEGF